MNRSARIARLVTLWACMALGVLLLAGCATTAPAVVNVPVPVPCPAAEQLPEAPPRSLSLNPAEPGAAVQAYAANRTRWIGYADALRERLESCK